MNTQPKTKNPAAVALGRLGGKAGRGQSKARTTEQARAAVAVRWNKVKAQKESEAPSICDHCGVSFHGVTHICKD